ncbi:MAG: hypothetical protein KAI08_08820 [Bacteroidales bacterium]|nr:hypothetical protein [Bacteroidales bacterium]
MNKLHRLAVILFSFLLGLSSQLYAQEPVDTTTLWLIETVDGNSFMGTLVEEDTTRIILLTEIYSRIQIPRTKIKKIKVLEPSELVEGELWYANPHSTRSFFGPTGYGLRKGEAYYQNTWIFYNQISYGATDYFSIGGGLLPLFLFAGSPTPVWITPKVSIPIVKEKVNLGAGALLAWVLGEDFGFGIGYGVLTLGSRDRNLTLGAGWAFSDGLWADSPTLTLSGMTRVGRKTYLLTENYYIGVSGDSSFGILSVGGRSVQKRLSIDYGLVFPVGLEQYVFFAIPWLGISIPFGKTQ